MWRFCENALLLLSHVHPTVSHRHTPECLLCRHLYAAARPLIPNVISFCVGQRYPSENEILATNNFNPKYLTYCSAVARVSVLQQVRYTFYFLHYTDAGPACTLTVPVRAAAPTKTRNACVVVGVDPLPSNFTSAQQLVCYLSAGSWVQCDKLVVLGVEIDYYTDWKPFVRAAQTVLVNNGLLQHALFIYLGTVEHAKNFLAWLQYTNGRVSIRTLVQHQLLQFDSYSTCPNWDIPFFV